MNSGNLLVRAGPRPRWPAYESLKPRVAVGPVAEVGADQCSVGPNSASPFVAEGCVFDFEAMRDKGSHERLPLEYAH